MAHLLRRIAALERRLARSPTETISDARANWPGRLADYGLKDGRIFDFIGRTTPSGGVEQNFLGLVFKITKF